MFLLGTLTSRAVRYEVHSKGTCVRGIVCLKYPAFISNRDIFVLHYGPKCLQMTINKEGIEMARRRCRNAQLW